ncbi:MAG TPA: hypothetical protein VJH95_05555 [Candidatus Nanoarchaeia archaeon]|nr:hypothetical protein [Candidatus Nanoarchaeia archaeon]
MSKKKIKKGIESIATQIELHKQKHQTAIEKRDNALASYYEHELERLQSQILEKQKKLGK